MPAELERFLSGCQALSIPTTSLERQAFCNNYLALMMLATDGTITYLNSVMAGKLSHSFEELIGKSVYSYFQDPELLAKAIREAMADGVSQPRDFQILSAENHERGLTMLMVGLTDEQMVFKGALVLGHQSRTYLKPFLAEAAEPDHGFLSTVLNYLQDVIFTLDQNSNIQYINGAVTSLLGYNPQDLFGKNIALLLGDPDFLKNYWREQLEKGPRTQAMVGRLTVQHKDGSRFIARLVASAPSGGKSSGIALVGTLRDIADELDAERSLMERNRQLATLSRITSIVAQGGSINGLLEKVLMIAMQDQDLRMGGIFIFHPKSGFGENVVYRGVPQILIERYHALPITAQWLEFLSSQTEPLRVVEIPGLDELMISELHKYQLEDLYFQAIRNKGRIFGVLYFLPAQLLSAEGRAMIEAIGGQLGVALDNHRLLAELRDSQSKYSVLIERANDGIMISQDGVFKFVNKKLADVLGYRVSDMVGMDITTTMAPEDAPTFLKHYENRISGQVPKEIYQGRLKKKNDDLIQVEFNAITIDFEGRPASLSFVRDLSERIELQHKLVAEKETAEFYNDVLTHDVKNMLQTITGYTDLLSDAAVDPGESDFGQHLVKVRKTAHRCAALIDQVRELMMIRNIQPETLMPVPLRPLISEALDLVRDQFSNTPFDVQLNIGENKYILGHQLANQIFINLISNAVRHNSKDEKWVKVTVSDSPDSRGWKVVIEDNGDGIAPEMKSKIYKRFVRFSKKEGIGLGMSIVKALVDVLSGTISIEDRLPGRQAEGTRFIIVLPKG